MTPEERAQRIRQESEQRGETVTYFLQVLGHLQLQTAELVRGNVSGQHVGQRAEQWLTTEEVAELWQVSVRKVKDAISLGQVHSYKIGHLRRFRLRDLEAVKPPKRVRRKLVSTGSS